MKQEEKLVLGSVTGALERMLKGEVPESIPVPTPGTDQIQGLCQSVNGLIQRYSEARHFLLALSEGKLEVEPPPRNFLISAFKELHANLRHLTWQTHQITRGDLSQHVDFLGDFSTSFNAMIDALREKQTVERARERSEKRLRDITTALGDGVYVLDLEGRLVFMNPEAERLLGWEEKELLGKSIHDAVHLHAADGQQVGSSECPFLTATRSGETYRSLEDAFSRRDGSTLPVALVSTPLREEGHVVGSTTAFHDISNLRASQEVLRHANEVLALQAATDVLTGIPNRLHFDASLKSEYARARRHAKPLSLIIFDVDNFKQINDNFGHSIGDMVLQQLVGVVQKCIRQEEIFARWGGDEFVILLPLAEAGGAVFLAERLRTEIQQAAFDIVKRITCSFGVAQLRDQDEPKGLLERADESLYRAKSKGRNRVEVESR